MEKTIIAGKPSKKTQLMPLMIGAAVFALGLLGFLLNLGECRAANLDGVNGGPHYASIFGVMVFAYAYVAGALAYPVSVLLDLGVALLIVGLVAYLGMRKVSIQVTNKRVSGTTAFGRRIDLPMDESSAVGTSALKSLVVSTSSGTIKFSGIENRDEVHAAITKLLNERQGKGGTTIRQEIPQSNADELAKYKDLLDKGILTQEEFDAKKKMLLGL